MQWQENLFVGVAALWAGLLCVTEERQYNVVVWLEPRQGVGGPGNTGCCIKGAKRKRKCITCVFIYNTRS